MGISLSQMAALEPLPWGQLRYCFLVTVTELLPLTPELLSIGPAAMCQAELASPSGNLCGFSCPTEVPNLASVLRAFHTPKPVTGTANLVLLPQCRCLTREPFIFTRVGTTRKALRRGAKQGHEGGGWLPADRYH